MSLPRVWKVTWLCLCVLGSLDSTLGSEVKAGSDASSVVCNHGSTLQLQYAEERALCVVVRTMPEQNFEGLLTSLFTQKHHDAHALLRVYAVNTDGTDEGMRNVTQRLAFWQQHYAQPGNVCSFNTTGIHTQEPSYGYYHTDAVLDALTGAESPPCRYVMVTNGDNLYNTHLLDLVVPKMNGEHKLIAFDFVSRYPRHGQEVQIHQAVWVKLECSNVDLGSYILAFEVYAAGHRFVHEGQVVPYSDWTLLERVLGAYGPDALQPMSLHNVLMFHQK